MRRLRFASASSSQASLAMFIPSAASIAQRPCGDRNIIHRFRHDRREPAGRPGALLARRRHCPGNASQDADCQRCQLVNLDRDRPAFGAYVVQAICDEPGRERHERHHEQDQQADLQEDRIRPRQPAAGTEEPASARRSQLDGTISFASAGRRGSPVEAVPRSGDRAARAWPGLGSGCAGRQRRQVSPRTGVQARSVRAAASPLGEFGRQVMQGPLPGCEPETAMPRPGNGCCGSDSRDPSQ